MNINRVIVNLGGVSIICLFLFLAFIDAFSKEGELVLKFTSFALSAFGIITGGSVLLYSASIEKQLVKFGKWFKRMLKKQEDNINKNSDRNTQKILDKIDQRSSTKQVGGLSEADYRALKLHWPHLCSQRIKYLLEAHETGLLHRAPVSEYLAYTDMIEERNFRLNDEVLQNLLADFKRSFTDMIYKGDRDNIFIDASPYTQVAKYKQEDGYKRKLEEDRFFQFRKVEVKKAREAYIALTEELERRGLLNELESGC